MSRRSGLGTGIGALIPTEGATGTPTTTADGLREIPISSIQANRHQPRTVFDEESLN